MKKIAFLLLAFFALQSNYSQSYKIYNTAGGSLEKFGNLMDGDEIFGYVELRKLDLDDKLTVRYKYIVLDKNMNTICSGEFIENLIKRKCEKRFYDYEYNNGHIIFNFKELFDESRYLLPVRVTYQILDIAKNKIVASGNYDKEIVGDENIPKLYKKYKQYLTYPLSDNGFLIEARNSFGDDSKIMYYGIDFLGNKIWEQPYKTAEEKHKYEYGLIKNDISTTVLLVRKSRNEKKVSDHLLVIDTKTGKEISFTDLSNDIYTLRFSNLVLKDGKVYIMGRYFEKQKRDQVDSEESLGLYRRIVDIKTGKIESDIFLPYSKFNNLDINENGRVKKEGYLSFQNINMNPDGSCFVLAETYISKSAGAIFTELYAFLLDKNFNPISVKSFDVNRTRGSKYSFSQDLPNKVGKAYFFYDKNEDKEFELNIINFIYATNSYTVNKMKLKNDKSSISVVPAKTGYVGIMEYFSDVKKGDKDFEIRLEKLNYER